MKRSRREKEKRKKIDMFFGFLSPGYDETRMREGRGVKFTLAFSSRE
ncbi:MAG: hypothetical protein ABFS35_22375 [Bacteroidota bacterium]